MIKIVMIRDQSRSWCIVSGNGEPSHQKVNSLTRHSTALVIDFSKNVQKIFSETKFLKYLIHRFEIFENEKMNLEKLQTWQNWQLR